MSGKARTLYFAVLLGLALAVPYVLAPSPDGEQSTARSDTAAAQAEESGPAPAPAIDEKARQERSQQRRVERIETDTFVAEVVNLNGGLRSFRLKGERFRDGDRPIDIVTTDKERFLPLALEVEGLPPEAAFELERLSPTALRLQYQGQDLRVTRKVQAGQEPYQLWLTTRIENVSSSPKKARLEVPTYHYVGREESEGGIPLLPVQSPALSKALCRASEDLVRETHDELYDARSFPNHFYGQELRGPVAFTAVENVYFVSAVAPSGQPAEACRILSSPRGGMDPKGEDALGDLFAARLRYSTVELAPGESKTYRTLAYLGPKMPDPLAQSGHSLKEAIETGWFTALAEALTWLLRRLYDLIGNWGLAIIALTFLVKLLLYPLTAKQMQSMARMKELKPELDEINKRFADDREAKGAAMMNLYRKKGVNPAAGCFPVLLQLPIWFSLYTSLATNVELFHADFALWWNDLSSPDPYFSLPLALGVLMFVQQKMTPATGMDPLQQKMMLYMMPTMITSFMLFLPVGLCLYMFTNSALSIVQQRVIEARIAAKPSATTDEAASPSSPEATSNPPDSPSESGPARKARPKSSRPSKAERRSRRGK